MLCKQRKQFLRQMYLYKHPMQLQISNVVMLFCGGTRDSRMTDIEMSTMNRRGLDSHLSSSSDFHLYLHGKQFFSSLSSRMPLEIIFFLSPSSPDNQINFLQSNKISIVNKLAKSPTHLQQILNFFNRISNSQYTTYLLNNIMV